MDSIEQISLFLGVLATLATVTSALFIRFIFAPVCEIEVLPRWSTPSMSHLIVTFRFKNTSKVRVENPEIVAHIDFHAQSIESLGPRRIDNQEVANLGSILVPTIYGPKSRIFSEESIQKEFVVAAPEGTSFVYIELRVRMKLGVLRKLLLLKREDWSQTCTKVISR